MVDAASATKGFKYNSSATSPHYTHDNNGNLTYDKHKDLAFVYNYLNLPNSINNPADSYITLTYTADGEKLTKISPAGTRNYVAGIEYLGANLDAIYHAEGRCTPNGATAFHYEYTLKDHLGNARVNFRANGTAVVFIEDMHYYPFGMQMEGIGVQNPANKYLYNGKERNEDLGLNLSDYGARWYDAALGRWWSVDLLAETQSHHSAYAYVYNNPLIMVDPTGLYGEGADGLSNDQWIQSSRQGGEIADKFRDENRDKDIQRGKIQRIVDNALEGEVTATASARTGIIITETSTNREIANVASTTTFEFDEQQSKYANSSTLKEGGNSGPFASLSIVDYTKEERNDQLIFRFSYQLVANRIQWANIGLHVKIKEVGVSAEKNIETGGGTLGITATFVFDAKSMVLVSQASQKSEKAIDSEFGAPTSAYVPFSTLAASNLKVQAFTYINWTNNNCGATNNFCGTGNIIEPK